LKRSDIPEGWSLEAADFANKLLQRKPANRLGFHGPQDVKNHGWLRSFNWQKLYEKTIETPYVPPVRDPEADRKKYMNDKPDDQDDTIRQNSILLRQTSVQALFAGYFFDHQQRKM
jgi:hypothetical protein